jgi:CxxC motif-containing protein (DUF1111 family)
MAVGIAGLVGGGCNVARGDAQSSEDLEVTTAALTASISGTIRDTSSNPLSGVTVVLNGRTQATTVTGASGTYSFPLYIPESTGSWSVQPYRTGCSFSPQVANLNNIGGSRVQNFTGSGVACVGALTPPTLSATDPGPRGGPAGAGPNPLAGLTAQEQALFLGALGRFEEVDSVSGTIAGENGEGLGPTFNGNSCAMCHAEPGVGGTSPGLNSAINPRPNPQVALATLHGALNIVPPFITAAGPIREERFPIAAGGGVAGIYTIRGRTDAPGCTLMQPNFAAQIAANDIIFRIPTPTFGLGLVENTPDLVLQANLAANSAQKAALGISGHLNLSGNDGTITRFGWKAQNKSLLVFAGEAYNVEQGVSNENFPNERSAVPGCVFNGSPEDHTDNDGLGSGPTSNVSSDIVNFAVVFRFLAPPTPAPSTPSTTNGLAVFNTVGCGQCHTPTLTTGPSPFTPLSNVTYSPFSDIAVHNMGTLADRVSQGNAGPDEFRSAPLWGVGQRLFFLHDGRTTDIVTAIQAHFSAGSEANTTVLNLAAQSSTNQQDLVNFLRSL